MGASGAAGWLDYKPTPRAAFTSPTPPGPEGSKGTRALTGARGVPSFPRDTGKPDTGTPRALLPGDAPGPPRPARMRSWWQTPKYLRAGPPGSPWPCTASTGTPPSPK